MFNRDTMRSSSSSGELALARRIRIRSTRVGGEPGLVMPPFTPGLDFKEAKQRVVDAFELAYLKQLLARHDGNITRSAQEAGLTRYHLRELLKRHGLTNVKE